MFWQESDHPPCFNTPNTLVEAIELLEAALDVVLAGLREVDEMNAAETPVPWQPSDAQQFPSVRMVFTEPPPHTDHDAGELAFNWDGHRLCWWPTSGALLSWKPQTIFTQIDGQPWHPAFAEQVQRDISTSVQFLAPVCEQAGWPSDPFDRLLAWGVGENLIENKQNLQDALVLLAKLRRRHGLPGRGFNSVPHDGRDVASSAERPDVAAHTASKRKPAMSKKAKALAALADHPEWPLKPATSTGRMLDSSASGWWNGATPRHRH